MAENLDEKLKDVRTSWDVQTILLGALNNGLLNANEETLKKSKFTVSSWACDTILQYQFRKDTYIFFKPEGSKEYTGWPSSNAMLLKKYE